jgi:hypothetical protein
MNKYNARRVQCDGYTFDSQAEAYRYGELVMRVRAGEIVGLKVHPRFELQPAFRRNGRNVRAITYTADFSYTEDGRCVVEDVKGGVATQTQLFRVKAKMFWYRYPDIEFRVIER